jgi:hypothetical protein
MKVKGRGAVVRRALHSAFDGIRYTRHSFGKATTYGVLDSLSLSTPCTDSCARLHHFG